MALVTLTFTAPINASCQVGDTAYFVQTASSNFDPMYPGNVGTNQYGGTTSDADHITTIGPIREITNRDSNSPTMVCYSDLTFNEVNGLNRFIMFSKDNRANLNSLTGYYASVKMVNDSTEEAELFSVGLDMFGSSK